MATIKYKDNQIDKKIRKYIDERFLDIEEGIISYLMENLKPELKDKVVWRFDDGIVIEGEGVVRARIQNMRPAKSVITFYSRAIAHSHFSGLVEDIKAIIRHEIAHLFVKGGEEAVSQKEQNWNIFRERKI